MPERLLQFGYYVLWIGTPVLLACVAVLLRRRKLHIEFPFFYRYVLFQAGLNLALIAIHRLSYAAYFYGYWVGSAVLAALEFGIIYEIFAHLFRPYPYLRDFGKVVFRWAGSLLVVIALLFAVTATAQEDPIVVSVLWLQRSIRLVQCGLVFFLLYFCSYLGITRRHYLFGIALGFGTFASAELALFASRIATGYISDQVFSFVAMAAYNWAALIWLLYFRAQVPAAAAATAGQQWDRGVADLLHPDRTELGLLARIDKMVEDAIEQSRVPPAKSPEAETPKPQSHASRA